mgnify:CR=1 FL=1
MTLASVHTTPLGAVHKLCCLGRGKGGNPKDDLLHTSMMAELGGQEGSEIAVF